LFTLTVIQIPHLNVVSITRRYALRKYKYILAKRFWMGRGISLHFYIDDTSPAVREVRRGLTKKCIIEIIIYKLMLKGALTNNNATYLGHACLCVFLCTVNEAYLCTYSQKRSGEI